MKSTIFLQAFALTLPVAQALSMVDYSPATDVETSAEAFFKEFYTTAENSSATTTYTDFFTSDATLKVLTNTAQGSAAILKMQQYFLPTDGSKQWNHFPNNVTISGETSTNKTYDVHATLQTSYTGGNCSTSYLQARFTITKDETAGTVNLEAHSGSIAMLDDYFVNPTVSPTDIECTK